MLFNHKQQFDFQFRSLWIQTLFILLLILLFCTPTSKMNLAPLLLIPRWTGNKVQASCELVDPVKPPESQNICRPQPSWITLIKHSSAFFIIHVALSCALHESKFPPDHPAGSIEDFRRQCSVQPAEPWQTDSHAASQHKEFNNNKMTFVNDFHIRTEVSSVQTGNHLHAARHGSSREESGWQYRVMFGIFPPPAALWKDSMGFPTELPSCFGEILITHHEGC